MVSAARLTWTNWSGTYTCSPARVESPSSEEEIAGIVRAAAERGEHVKVAGSGHSFTDIGVTDGCLIKLGSCNKVLEVDRDARTITAQAGITILELSDALAHFGLAMENMGDVGYQTISGAISTATHGTGERFGNISSQVVALSLVTAAGEVVHCSAEREPETFKAAQVGLGALGVISSVTLRCVPAYNIHSIQQPRKLDDLLEEFDELCAKNDHFELFWFPHTEVAQSIANTRTEDPPHENQRRTWIPGLAAITARTMSRKEMTDRSDRIFANTRLVRFAEMEYAVPRSELVAAMRDIRSMIERQGLLISFPVEVRVVAADDIPLSPAYGR